MTNHPHLLVFINSFTKNFMFLDLTRVDFNQPYTRLGNSQKIHKILLKISRIDKDDNDDRNSFVGITFDFQT